jgi:hypothetical protein
MNKQPLKKRCRRFLLPGELGVPPDLFKSPKFGGLQGVEQHRANPIDKKRCRRFLLPGF